ncbi:MAG: creatininase family protein [Halobacteriales archaeon]
MRLAEATSTDAAAAETDLAVLPVGSTEQHGPHAPLSTDTLNAAAVAEAGVAAFDEAVVLSPPIPYGISAEHRRFAGTCWLSPDTFRAVVREAVESLISHGWRRVVVVNGHGGNIDALREVAAAVSRTENAHVAAFTWFEAVGEHGARMGHAGPLETAMLRCHHPELVRDDRVETAAAESSDRWGDWVAGVNLAHDSDEFTENGVVGDPTAGDADLGAELTELAADALADLLAALDKRPLSGD